MALVFALGLGAFITARSFFVPHDFGVLGFYRAGAVDEIKALPIRHAGHDTCEVCHGAVIEARGETKHARISCETCHGPLQAHADDPTIKPAAITEPQHLCLKCHAKVAGRPASFPQVSADSHPVDADCTVCHKPHSPKINVDPVAPARTGKGERGSLPS